MGKSTTAPPDYTGLMAASSAAQAQQAAYANQMMNFTQQQYNDLSPKFNQLADQQAGTAAYQTNQGRAMGDMYSQTYMPLMQEQANAARNFNTEAHREGLAQEAAADVARAFSNQQAASARGMASMGVNPNSGRFAGLQRATDLSQAAQRAAAMTGTRRQAEAEGQNRMNTAIAQGQGLAGASNNAFNSALSAGNAAGNMYMAPGQMYMSGLGAAAGQMAVGQQMGLDGLSASLQGQGSLYTAGLARDGAMMQGLGSMAGMAAGGFLSDRRLKEKIERVGEYPNGLPMYEFQYKIDPDGTRWRGVMADDVERVYPDAVNEFEQGQFEGFKWVDYGKLGIAPELASGGTR
jgi:hypothetical protein